MAWVNQSWEAPQPFSGGRNYVNYLRMNDEAGVQSAYGTHYPRLVALKNTCDPSNFFHLNRHARPTAGERGPRASPLSRVTILPDDTSARGAPRSRAT
jgi:hypothetical protein